MTGERTSGSDRWIFVCLLGLAVLAWSWTIVSTRPGNMDMGSMGSASHALDLAAFLAGWVAMMTAMMFPAIVPVVRLYALATARGRAAPVPVFIAGYLTVWSAAGLPAWAAWRALRGPLAEGATWAAWIASAALLAAAVYQLTPLKTVCLRHCRSPIGFFAHHGRGIGTARGAFRAGTIHGGYCLGCCWALMVVLVAFGTMHLAWMAALALLILVEKTFPHGEAVGRLAAAGFAALALWLLVQPHAITTLS
jgi:predicted metal-binding membrane protein